jgi:hypothetical protein
MPFRIAIPESPSFALRRPILFGWMIVALMLAGKLIVGPLAVGLGDWNTTEVLVRHGAGVIFLSFLTLPIETLLGQWLPIEALRLFGARHRGWMIGGAAALFAALHLSVGVGAFVLMLPAGAALAWAYLAWRERSMRWALAATTLAHIAHNAVCFAIAGLEALVA